MSEPDVVTVECSECGGDGLVVAGWDAPSHENREVCCPYCDGEGEIEVDAETYAAELAWEEAS